MFLPGYFFLSHFLVLNANLVCAVHIKILPEQKQILECVDTQRPHSSQKRKRGKWSLPTQSQTTNSASTPPSFFALSTPLSMLLYLCLSLSVPPFTYNPFTLCQEVIWIQWVCAVDPLFLRRGGLEKCIVLSQQKSQRDQSLRASHSFQRIARMKVKVLSFRWHCSFSVWYIFILIKRNEIDWFIYPKE